MLWTVFLLTLSILSLGLLSMCVGIFFGRRHKFPETSVGKNEEMQKRNITCARCDELQHCRSKR